MTSSLMATAPEPIASKDAENASFPALPPIAEERPPLVRASLLDVSPVSQRLETLDAMRIVCMAVIIITHVTEPYLDAVHKRAGQFSSTLTLAVLAINVMGRFGV